MSGPLRLHTSTCYPRRPANNRAPCSAHPFGPQHLPCAGPSVAVHPRPAPRQISSHSNSRPSGSTDSSATVLHHLSSAAVEASSTSASQNGQLSTLELPIMPLGKVKLPTDLVTLQLFEPRYRLMFRLVNKLGGRNRLFGVVLSDRRQGTMESVGALCEMVTFSPLPEQRRIFVLARVVGRFRVRRVISDAPFITATVSRLHDGDDAGGASDEGSRGRTLEKEDEQAAQDTQQFTEAMADALSRRRQPEGPASQDAAACSSGTTEDELLRRIAEDERGSVVAEGDQLNRSSENPAGAVTTEAVNSLPTADGTDRKITASDQAAVRSGAVEGRTTGAGRDGEVASSSAAAETGKRQGEAASAAEKEEEQQQVRRAELRVWQAMQDVRALASKLYGHMGDLGDDTFSIEVRRWCPDPSVLAHHDLPVLDPAILDVIEALKLHHRQLPPGPPSQGIAEGDVGNSGREEGSSGGSGGDGLPQDPSWPSRQQADGGGGGTTAAVALQLASDGRGAVSEAVRQERFSFAALRSCADVSEQQLQAMVYCTSTLTRLQLVESILRDGLQYLAARSALRDVF